jgi:2-polyprenyl-6-methoxyphenol hydroxylase-like FAD-dependent oxidoreductase
MNYDFIISGGGIAGLTTAIALQKEGYHVKVLERVEKLKEVGAGLGLGANAWKGLAYLRITDDLEMKCNLIKSTKILDQKGKLISEVGMERLNEKYGMASFTVHRADLMNTLFLNLKRDTVEFGNRVVDYEQTEDKVTVCLEDGTLLEGGCIDSSRWYSFIYTKKMPPSY